MSPSPSPSTPVTSRLSNAPSFSPAVSRATCTAGPPTFSRAMTRITRTGRGSCAISTGCRRSGLSAPAIARPVPCDRPAQPLQEADLRLVAEVRARPVHIRPRVLDVAGARVGVYRLHLAVENLLQVAHQLVERGALPGGEVKYPACRLF